MNSAGVISRVGLQEEPIACPQCGSTSRVGRDLCLNCLLYRGLGEETYDNETLESVLKEVDVRDADWRLGNYQILEEIGRGGMGVIYRARQRHSRRIVALKRILPHHADSRDTLVRFRREAEAAASLDHPNILPIYEVSEGEDGLPFFSMKLATGGSLLEGHVTLRDQPRQAIGLMAKVSRAVDYAHSRSILHRDLKPGNILLDSRAEPLVSDFGLAKWLDESSDLTRTLTIFGTPGYIAPEQAHGPASSLKPTADVYSLGAILFDLLAGRPPFLGEHALSVIEQAKEKPAPKLRSVIPKIDRDLETICARCLEREPTARYHSAGDLAGDLDRWLEGRPIVARPVPPAVRIWRWGRRNPKLASSVGGCVLGGLVALAFVTFTLLPDTSPFRPGIVVPEKSIAVLPFENLSAEKESAYFTDGVQDEVLNDLAKVADLKVISRTSVMQYKGGVARNLREIAKALGVTKVVEGAVQRTGDRVRVSAELIDARTDAHLWAESYDRELVDIFAVESELAEQIVSKLRARLSPEEKEAIEERPTSDMLAYDLYIRAKALLNTVGFSSEARENLIHAVQLLDQAVARDPHFLAAFYQLATANDQIYFLGMEHTSARLALAEAAVRNVSKLRPDSGEAHLALAQHLYFGYRDYDHTRKQLALAQRTLPNESLVNLLAGYIDRRQGRWDESNREFERALELDPSNLSVLQQISFNDLSVRNFPKMAAVLDRALSVAPGDVTTRIHRAAVDFYWRADLRPMSSVVQGILDEHPDAGPSISAEWFYLALRERDRVRTEEALKALPSGGCTGDTFYFPHAWFEGVAARSFGDNAKAAVAFSRARSAIQDILRDQPDYAQELAVLGTIDAALGRKEEAIGEGRRARELLPINKDSVVGAGMIELQILIYIWTNEKDLALRELALVTKIPSDVNYGTLRLDPTWDPLRGDPRFEQIVASLAPKAKKNATPRADGLL